MVKTKSYRELIWMRWAGRSISLLSGSLFTAVMIGIIGQDMSIGGFPGSDFEGWVPLILGILRERQVFFLKKHGPLGVLCVLSGGFFKVL